MKDYYKILELQINSTQDEIKSQYRLLVNAWHPDKFSNSQQRANAEERLKDINEAYSVLGNLEKRRNYDSARMDEKYQRTSSQKTYQQASSSYASNYQSSRGPKAEDRREPPERESPPKYEPPKREPYSRSSTNTSQTDDNRSEKDIEFQNALRLLGKMFANIVRQKNLLWFLLFTFVFSWILFLLPLLSGAAGTPARQNVALVTWSIAMWGPGLAAILINRLVDRKPFGALNLQRLGEWRMYLWAWLLPFFLTLAAGVLTWLLGAGRLDLEFTQIRETMAQASGPQMPPLLIVGLQIALALTLGPLFNTLFAMGEELGWRGYLLPNLLPLGQTRAILLSGVIWGIWHAPVILQGHNYPSQPVIGVFMMIVFCVLYGAILSWIYLRTRSPWAPALGHGSLNAVAGLSVVFMPGVDLVVGGPLTSLIGWIPLVLFAGWLVWSKRLPVADEPQLEPARAASFEGEPTG